MATATRNAAEQYAAHSEKMRLASLARTKAHQDIAPLPKIKDPIRRRDAIDSYETFCQAYFPTAFTLPWSPYHKRAADKIQRAITSGGMFAWAMPRGSGKTTMCEWGVLWAILTGRSPYTVFVGASEQAAERRLKNLKTQFQLNDLLLQDFPAEVWPVRALDNSARKAEGQRYKTKHTFIAWQSKQITLAHIPEEHAFGSSARVDVFGLTGEIRGLNHTRPDGTIQRPTLAICDDPQTRESAKSPSQSHTRERTMAGDIAYLSGPGEPIAVLCPCTVIYPGDLADNLLDRDKHPEFQGERSSMVLTFPDDSDMWDKYADILQQALRTTGTIDAATEFYRDNQAAMDKGAKVSWPERFRSDEISGIQHAMNLKIRDSVAFFAECQNQPHRDEVADLTEISADTLAVKQSGFKRREIPSHCDTLTAFIDVQGSLLYWLVAAWDKSFTGFVLDYGSFPKQTEANTNRAKLYYTLPDARQTLKNRYPGADDEAVIYKGLTELVDDLVGAEWVRDDGATLRIKRCMVDANWGGTSALVNQCLRQSVHAPVLTPSYGRGVKASHRAISQWQQSRGGQYGPEWVPTQAKGKQLVGILSDVNYWKKRCHDALSLDWGSRGSIGFFKARPDVHRMIADHITAEVPRRVSHDTRTVYEWQAIPGRDNHLWDCLVGSMVAASACGVDRQHAATSDKSTTTTAPPRRGRRIRKF
tara:strand:- start:327 stop:2432 length:2106 start_codon:yes stop_codon:yes gene_type:complete